MLEPIIKFATFLTIVILVIVMFYRRSRLTSRALIPALGSLEYGVKTVTVNITKEELNGKTDEEKLKLYVAQYLFEHPIPDEFMIDRGLQIKYIDEATRLLKISYRIQFNQSLECWLNPATHHQEILDEIEKKKGLDMGRAQTVPQL